MVQRIQVLGSSIVPVHSYTYNYRASALLLAQEIGQTLSPHGWGLGTRLTNHSTLFSHDTWTRWWMEKFKISVWMESKCEVWEVNWVKSILSHELEHSRNQNRECRNVTSLWWLLLDDFPLCGMGLAMREYGFYHL